jgi:acyl carrier protein
MPLTRDALAGFLTSKLGLSMTDVDDATPLFSSGLIDSFSMVDLLLFVEESIGKRIDPSEVSLDNLDSVERILAFATAKSAG